MNNIDDNYQEIVRNLNGEIYDKLNDQPEYEFGYLTNGYVDLIMFADTIIWNSDNDERLWIEENNDYEPLEPYIKKIFNEYVDKLELFKF